MERKIKFSYIIPTLNEGAYIGRCISTIKKQKRRDYEVIIVDSCSRDKTVPIARKFGARVFFERRKGPGIARNTGAKHAKGEILIFPDADVVFPANFLDGIESNFSRKTVIGGICKLVPYDGGAALSGNYRMANMIARFMISIGVPMTAGSCFIYRKGIFQKAKGFNPKFITNEDHDLARRTKRFGRFCYFDIPIGTSTRRVKRWGLFKAIRIYIKSSMMFFLNHKYIHGYWE